MKTDIKDGESPASLNGAFRVEITLASQSKGKRNDFKPQETWKEMLERKKRENETARQATAVSTDETNANKLEDRTRSLEQVSLQQLQHQDAEPFTSKQAPDEKSEIDEHSSEAFESEFSEGFSEPDSLCGSEGDEFFELKWLEQMDTKVLWTPVGSSKAVEVGHCSGKLIRRAKIQNVFHDEMEGPSRDTAKLGFGLFDRYGRLKPDFKTHSIKQGSGIWQDEMDTGDLLFIDYIHVEPRYRRQQLGRQMFAKLFEEAKKKAGPRFFAIIQACYLIDICNREMGDVTDKERTAFCHRAEDIAVEFWRKLGFRRIGSSGWFGLASDPKHACYQLKIIDDYDPQAPGVCEVHPVFEAVQKTIATAGEDECVDLFKKKLAELGPEHHLWYEKDQNGNNLLHLAAISHKSKVLIWIVKQSFASDLARALNNKSDNPLGALLSQLEDQRIKKTSPDSFKITPCSDNFKGFDLAAVTCLAILKGHGKPSKVECLQMKYGCTCGQCIGGFLSPRMSFVLLYQAEQTNKMLSYSYDHESDEDFVYYHEDEELQFLEPSVRQNLTTNKSMRQGFIAIFGHFATCIENKTLPTEANIKKVIEESGEWPPHSKNFFRGRGAIGPVGSAIFEKARAQDRWAGYNLDWEVFQEEIFQEEIQELPACRNDLEFGFVSSMCGYKRVSAIRYINLLTGLPMDLD